MVVEECGVVCGSGTFFLRGTWETRRDDGLDGEVVLCCGRVDEWSVWSKNFLGQVGFGEVKSKCSLVN